MSAATQTTTALTIGQAPRQRSRDWRLFQQLPCRISLEIPVPGFTVSALLRLAPNDVITTGWLQGSDVPLRVNGKIIGWTEFEVIDDRLAARLTQIA
jgi:flagellar motor switch protein FliN/FliY